MVSIFVAGDVINYNHADGMICSDILSDIIKKSDYSICNFEAPVEGFGKPQIKSGPHHTQRVKTPEGLKKQGFDALLLANNHTMDFGIQGLVETIKYAEQNGLDTVGAGVDTESAYQPLIKEVGSIKLGIVNACEAQFGVIDYFTRNEEAGYAWINHNKIDKLILKLKKECDFVLVFSHAGLENYNIPQKEWRERYQHLCDLGADVVIGAHPHVPQGYEVHNNSLIFYSLGNFYFDGGGYKNSKNPSFSVMLQLEKGESPNFKLVHHITENGKVTLSNKEQEIDVDYLCNLLKTDYEKLHDEMCKQAFKSIQTNLIKSVNSFPSDGTLKGTLKEFIATLLGRRKSINKPLLQMHLLRNEAYYYVLRNALELKNTKEVV